MIEMREEKEEYREIENISREVFWFYIHQDEMIII